MNNLRRKFYHAWAFPRSKFVRGGLASSIMLFSGHGPVHQTKLGADFVASLEVATLVILTN